MMDVFSHGLWGGVVLGRENKRNYFTAFGISMLPDFLSEGIMFILMLAGASGMPTIEHGHPDITEFPLYARNFYNATHSLLVFAAFFAVIWLITRKPPVLLFAWALHILIDIPTHSLDLFPTPFLWPLSSFRFNGIGWREPVVYITDILLLVAVYTVWLIRSGKFSQLF